MEVACDDAKRYAKDGDARAIQRVFHTLAWGYANSSSSIENAMARLEDETAMALVTAQETTAP